MHLKTYLIFLTFIFLSFLSVPQTTQAVEPLVLQTQNDQDVQIIFNTIVSAILKKAPWTDDTAHAQLLDDSVFNQGLIRGQLTLNSAPDSITQGEIETQILVQEDVALIKTRLTIKSTPATFYSAISESFPAPISTLTEFKQQIIGKIQAIPIEEPRKRTAFDPSTKTSSSLTEDQKQLILNTLESSIIVDSHSTGETLTVQMTQIQDVLSSIGETLPRIDWLTQLEQIEIHANSADILIITDVQSTLPKSVIQSYDSYLAQTQKSESGLSYPRDIVKSIGNTIVGMCSNSKYQEYCFNEILNKCARSVDDVATCVAKADSLRKAKEAQDSGNTLGAITNSASAAFQNGTQSVGNAIEDGTQAVGDAVDWLIGEDDEN